MTPRAMAAVHAAAFTDERPWSEAEFHALLDNKHVHAFHAVGGIALARTVAGESELLTLAVDPAHQRKGVGAQLCRNWLASLVNTADTAFLEVAADNHVALRLYAALGFVQTGTRRAYYRRENASSADAMIMQLDLTYGQRAESRS